jgi:radical SAM protein with 4Fe4S-binding SPASM domain
MEEEEYGPFYILELTQRCNHNCPHCYNVWKADSSYPSGELDTESWKRLISKLRDECDCRSVSFSGGEPLLREDFFNLLSFVKSRGMSANLISNASLLDRGKIGRCLEGGVALFEFPLLSHRREIHDGMSGAKCFDRVLDAIAEVKMQGGFVVGVFVATTRNILDLERTLELAFAFGVDGMLLNRFNPGGAGAAIAKELMPSIDSLKEALAIAERCAVDYHMSISCSIPMPPCVFDFSKYPHLGTGFCGAGTAGAYYTFDSLGNMRPCNHTSIILGNFLEESFSSLLEKVAMKEFMRAVPPACAPCLMREKCQGSCKASAQVCYGDLSTEEPFLKMAIAEAGGTPAYPAKTEKT